MPVPGAANIDDGVLFSLTNIRTLSLSVDRSVASLGPGLRWLEVYSWISQYGLGVTGGRFAPVGVSGLLLGGGISYFGSRRGWASNQVSNYEIVLANSTIVNANAQENSDLFWALKSGANNFGIVTRFDVKTFPLTKIYGGQTIYDAKYLPEVMDAANTYSIVGGGSDDADSAITPSVQFTPATGAIDVLCFGYRVGSDTNPAAFANYSRIPSLSTTNSVHESLGEALGPTAVVGERNKRYFYPHCSLVPSDYPDFLTSIHRQLFMAVGTKAGPDSVRLTNETWFETINSTPELKKVQNLTLLITPQLLSKSYLEAARASGGDPMDFEPGKHGVLSKIFPRQDCLHTY